MLVEKFHVDSPNVQYTEEAINSTFDYEYNKVERTPEGGWVVKPRRETFEFQTDARVPKLG